MNLIIIVLIVICFSFLLLLKKPKKIIPIGCDCHPTNVIKHLGIRNESMPFDWLNTNSLKGLDYVRDNINTKFKYYIKDLISEDDQVFAQRYNYSTFKHHKDLIDNQETRDTFIRRSNRFLDAIKNPCIFLYNVKSKDLNTQNKLDQFKKSVLNFKKVMKRNDELYIYIRYDESYNENRKYCDNLLKLNKIKNVKIIQHVRHLEKYGIWGDPKKYNILLKKFN